MNIRTKINLTLIVTTLISFTVLGYLIEHYSVVETKRVIYSYLYSNGRARAEHINTFINEQKITAKVLAAGSVYRDLLKEPENSIAYKDIKKKIDERLVRTMETDQNIFEAFILNRVGKIVASSDKTSEGLDKSQDAYFLKAQEGVYFKDIYLSPTIGKISYTISSPVRDSDGSFLGVSVLRFIPNVLQSIVINEGGIGNTEENFLINGDKYLITSTRFFDEANILKTKIDTKNASDCFEKSETDYITKYGYSGLKNLFTHADAVEAKDYRNIDVIATHTYIPGLNWCLITKVDKEEALRSQYLLLFKLWAYIIICLIVFIIIISWSIGKILKSILGFIEATRIYNDGKLDYRIEIKSKDEVGELGKSFNNMAEAVAQSRVEIETKVLEQTKEIKSKAQDLAEQKDAVLNILEDVEGEKNKAEELSRIVDDAREPIISKTLDGIIMTWNHGAEETYGYLGKEIIGKSIMTIVPEDKQKEILDIMKSVAEGKRIEHYQTVRRRKDGTLVDVSLSIAPVKDSSDKIVAISVISMDISKEKAVDKAKTEFVSLASHQLRTPLSSINWFTEMLLNGDAGNINADQKRFLLEIYTGSQRMVKLVNSLLNVSRLDLGTIEIDPKLIDVPKVIKSLLAELESQIIERKQVVQEIYEDNLPLFLADETLLRMVLQNLLSNAVKYGGTGSTITAEVKLAQANSDLGGENIKDNSFVIRISDTGIGIPKSQKSKIFDKLFRADNAKELETEGTGLGLYIIKSIVEQVGGQTWFESEENKVTTFYVSFPVTGMKRKKGLKQLD